MSDRDEYVALPEPGRRAAAASTSSTSVSRRRPTSSKIELAHGARARRLWPHDPRVKLVEDTVYADGDGEVFLASSKGVRGTLPREQLLRVRLRAGRAGRPGRDRSTRTRSGRDTRGPRRAGLRPRGGASAPAACWARRKCPSMKATVVLDPFVAASFFGVLSAALTADAVQKGRSLFAALEGKQVAGALVEPRRRRPASRRPRQRPVRRRGRAVPAHAAHPAAACCTASSTTRTRRARPAGSRPATACAARTGACPSVRPTNLVVERARDAAGRHRSPASSAACWSPTPSACTRAPTPSRASSRWASAASSSRAAGSRRRCARSRWPATSSRMLTGIVALGDDARWVPERQHPHAVGRHRGHVDRRRLAAAAPRTRNGGST